MSGAATIAKNKLSHFATAAGWLVNKKNAEMTVAVVPMPISPTQNNASVSSNMRFTFIAALSAGSSWKGRSGDE